jgi:predicted nucleic acid-binding protein
LVILWDTSAIYALAAEDDQDHAAAKRILTGVEDRGEELLIHSYLLVESFVLIRRRLGLEIAAAVSNESALAAFVTVDRRLHDRAVRFLSETEAKRPSLVDAVSFVVMKDLGIRRAFAFDRDFERAGFELCA